MGHYFRRIHSLRVPNTLSRYATMWSDSIWIGLNCISDAPLDYMTTEFYRARQTAIDQRLQLFTDNLAGDLVVDMISTAFAKWRGRSCRGVAWEKYTIETLCDVARCLGGPGVATIFRRFAMDFRMSVSGMPDLLLWDVKTRTCNGYDVWAKG